MSIGPLASARPWRQVDRLTLVLVLGAILVAAVGVAGAAHLDLLPLAAGLAAGTLILALGMRWPMVPLFLYVAIIPIDEIVSLGPLGTVGRTAAILFTVTYAVPRLRRLTYDAMPLSAWGFVGWAVLSATWALDPAVAVRGLSTLVQLFAIGLLIADVVVHRPGLVRPILWVFSISAAVTGLVGIGVYFSGQIVLGERAAALPGQDPAQFAAVLLPAFAFVLFELTAGRRRPLSATLAIALGSAILLSGTRGAWLSAAVVVALVVPRMRPGRRLLAAGVAAILVLVAAQIPAVMELVTFRAGDALTSGGSGRTDIWSVGLRIIESAPVIGVGYGNFPVAYTPELVFTTPLTTDTGAGRGPHDLLMGTTAELGLVGLFLLGAFVLPLLLRRSWGEDAAAVRAALASLLISSFFLDILGNRKQVWLILGLAAGLAYLERHRERQPAPDVIRTTDQASLSRARSPGADLSDP